MKVLVTGAKGMLGSDLCTIFADRHQVMATDIDEMDVRRPEMVFSTLKTFRPDLVIHLVALTDMDECEKQPDESYRTNSVGTQVMALACQEFGAEMVYVSTLSVFDGSNPDAYTEFDIPNPLSHYSRSKYQGELIVQNLLKRYYIVRAGWMFGGGKSDKKFVRKIIDLARSRSKLQIVNDKFGSPTYTRDLSNAICKLIETGWYGLYHLVNTGTPASRFEIAKQMLASAKISTCELVPVSSALFPLPAHRPRMEAGRNLHAELLGLDLMRPWQVALEDYIEQTLSLERNYA